MSNQNRTQLHDVLSETDQTIAAARSDATKGVAHTKNPDDILRDYTLSEIDDAGTTEYYGYVTGGSAQNWIIKTDNGSQMRWAKGTGSFATAWTGRAGGTYDYFFNVF